MSRTRSNQKQKGSPYETLAGEAAFTKVYDCQLKSAAFTDLTPRQRNLYIVCKAQTFGHAKPKTTSEADGEAYAIQEMFYLSVVDVQPYRIYAPTNKRDFYADMRALEEHGFIRMVACGKHLKHKNVYRLASEWRTWKKDEAASDGQP